MNGQPAIQRGLIGEQPNDVRPPVVEDAVDADLAAARPA
jgi:hypothetical protein